MKATCSVTGCESISGTKGWCSKHYQRWLKYGDPVFIKPIKDTCSVAGCVSVSLSKGLCNKHYQRSLIHGDPTVVKLLRGISVSERLEINKLEVQRDYETPCWEYQGSLDKDGYGRLCIQGKWTKTHRLAYIEFVGAISEGLQVLHKCDNPKCFNPDHLFLGTTQDNVDDMVKKGRGAKGSKVGNSKLTESVVKEILTTDFKYGGIIKLAKHLNVHRSTIDHIIKNDTWKHIT